MDDGHLFAVCHQPCRQVDGLHRGAQHHHMLAQLSGAKGLLRSKDPGAGELAFACAAHSHDHRIRSHLLDGSGIHRGVQLDFHPVLFQLMADVGQVIVKALVVALYAAGKVEQTADLIGRVAQGHAVAALRCNAGSFHTGRARADDQNLLLGCSRGRVKAFRHGIGVSIEVGGVHAAGRRHMGRAVVVVAVHALHAGAHVLAAVFLDLGHQLRVAVQRAVHEDQVQVAALDRIVQVVRADAQVHVSGAAHRNTDRRLDLLDHRQEGTKAGVAAIQHAAEVRVKIKLRAVAGQAVVALGNVLDIRCPDVHLLAVGTHADLEPVCTGCLQALCDFLALFDGGKQLVVAQGDVVFLHAVDQGTHRVIRTVHRLDLLDHTAEQAGAVLKGLRAILVLALVDAAGQEAVQAVGAGALDLDAVNAHLFCALCGNAHALNEGIQLFHRRLVDLFIRHRGGKAAIAELHTDLAAGIVDAVDQRSDRLHGVLPAFLVQTVRQQAAGVDHTAGKDVQRNAVFRHGAVPVGRGLDVAAGAVLPRTAACRLDDAVGQGHRAQLHRREHLGAVALKGIEPILLRVDQGRSGRQSQRLCRAGVDTAADGVRAQGRAAHAVHAIGLAVCHDALAVLLHRRSQKGKVIRIRGMQHLVAHIGQCGLAEGTADFHAGKRAALDAGVGTGVEQCGRSRVLCGCTGSGTGGSGLAAAGAAAQHAQCGQTCCTGHAAFQKAATGNEITHGNTPPFSSDVKIITYSREVRIKCTLTRIKFRLTSPAGWLLGQNAVCWRQR